MGEEKKIVENVIPLFPVSNIVLLPHIRTPFVVFEERYKRLVFDSITSSSLVGVFVLRERSLSGIARGRVGGVGEGERSSSTVGKEGEISGSEGGKEIGRFSSGGQFKIHEIGCAGKIISFSEAGENVYTVLVQGVFRVRLLDIIEGEPYDRVRFEILPDILPPEDVQERLKRDLIENAVRFLVKIGEKRERIEEIVQLAKQMRFQEVVNWAVFLHPLRFVVKLSLLAENSVEMRAMRFIDEVKKDISYIDIVSEFRPLKPRDPRVN